MKNTHKSDNKESYELQMIPVCKGVNTVYLKKKVKTKPHTSCPWRQHYIKDKPGSYNG